MACDRMLANAPDEGAVPTTGAAAETQHHSKHRASTAGVSLRARRSLGRRLLSWLRVEKIEGGLMVAGVMVAANCRLALPIFGCLFVLAGGVLTAAAYRGRESHEEPTTYVERVELTENSRMLGPVVIVVGALMLLAAILLCTLNRRAQQQERQRRVGFHCPIHGDFYPNELKSGELIEADEGGGWWCWRARQPADDEEALGPRRLRADSGGLQPPQAPLCPHSSHTSARSSLCSPWTNHKELAASPNPPSRCPTPQPFLIPSGSISSGLVPSARLSPDQTFGSIRSLNVTREVASFPLSRTPSPPPPRASLERCVMAEIATPSMVTTTPPPRPPPPTVRMVVPCEVMVE